MNKVFIIGFFIMLYVNITMRILYIPKEQLSNKYTYTDYINAYNILESQNNPTLKTISNKEYRKKLKIWQIYFESNVKDGYSLPQINTIVMPNNLSGEHYCILLSHEKTHIREYSANEKYVCFKNFEFLYTSKDPYLKQAGVVYGIWQLDNKYDKEYDIKGQIINYLKEKL